MSDFNRARQTQPQVNNKTVNTNMFRVYCLLFIVLTMNLYCTVSEISGDIGPETTLFLYSRVFTLPLRMLSLVSWAAEYGLVRLCTFRCLTDMSYIYLSPNHGGYVFAILLLSACCLSVSSITQKVVDEF